jgi:hypothetical protein
MAEETLTETAKPAAKTPPPQKTGLSSGRRVAIGVNVLFQVIAVLVIMVVVNWISIRRFTRWDISRDQKYALSSQTTNLLGSLTKPVTAIVYFSGGGAAGQIAPDVMALLKEYEYASKRQLTVETVDPYRNLTRAKELAEKYKFAGEENIVILDYDGRSKFVNANDMAEMDMAGGSPFMPAPSQVKAFKGEATLTTALLELVEGKPQKLYVTTGHGESEIREGQPQNPDDAVIVAEYLKRSNIKHDTIRLLDLERIPEDATAILVFGPKQDLSEREIELLDGYWNNKGRVFVLLNGGSKTPRLNAWLSKYGVTPGEGRLIRTVQILNLRTGQRENRVAGSAEGKFSEAGKSIVKDLAGNDAFFSGPSTFLDLDRAKASTEQLRFTELAEVGKEWWAELDPIAAAIPTRDPQREKEGPFTIAVAVEKGALDGVKVDTGRLIIVANSGFLTDGGLSQFDQGLEFALNSANWLLNRESGAGVGIPPKQKNLTPLTLDETQQRNLGFAVVLGLPAVVFVLGMISWLQRRN